MSRTDDDERFHRREAKSRRLAIGVVVTFLVAGLTGAVGKTGMLSSTTGWGPAGLLRVDFHRFTHQRADDSLTLTTRAVIGDTAEVEFAQRWIDAVNIDGIIPEPREQIQTAHGVLFRFATRGEQPVRATVTFRPSRIGKLDGWARSGGERVRMVQLVYP